MQLNITTDYAIRTLCYLAMQSNLVSSDEIAEKMGIPLNYQKKLIGVLRTRGWLETQAGKVGGVRLCVHPSEINLYEILTLMEKTMHLNRCLEEDEYCSRFATLNCPVRNVYLKTEKILKNTFETITLYSLLNEEDNDTTKDTSICI